MSDRDIHWSEVVEHASGALVALAPLAPLPASAVMLAAAGIARALAEVGCAILECPAEVAETLQPADLPTGDRGHDARARAAARANGLDRQGIDDRRQDADEITRSSR